MKSLSIALMLTLAGPSIWAATVGGETQQTAPAPGGKAAPSKAIQAARDAFTAGYAAAQRNDLPAARLSFEKAVRLAPGIATGHAALGSVLLSLDEIAGAVRELEVAHRLDSSDRSTLLNLCVAYSRKQDYKQSIKAYRELQGNGKFPELPSDAAIAVATAFSAMGDIPSAKDVVQRAVDTEPANARLQDALGTLIAQQQDFASAESRFRQAVSLDPALASAHYHLGSIEAATPRSTDALAELERAHSLEAGNVQYTLAFAQALAAADQNPAAIDLLTGALTKLPTQSSDQAIEVKYRLGLALQSGDRVKEALPLLLAVIAARPNDAEALTNAGLAHVQLGDAKAGISLYLRALKLTPSNPTLREDLGVAYLQQADLDHALEQFRAGLLIDDESSQLHYDLALALKLKDDLAAAVPEFERAAALDPQLPDPPFTLGIIYMQQGKFEKSAASFETALALRPENGEAWATLGSVYQQMQQPDKAIPALRRAIELMPQQPSPHINLAAILAGQGHKEDAAAERKIGAALTRAATNRQKANFGLDSGTLLLKRGQTAEALAQFQDAVDADPTYAAPHLALAEALDHAGRRAEAAEERQKAAALGVSRSSQP